MNDQAIADLITKLDNDTVYRASIHFYSKGPGDAVTTLLDVSHPLADDFDDLVPSAYLTARDILNALKRNATLYRATDEDLAYLEDPNLSQEEKASRVIDAANALEEALDAIKH